MKIPTKSVLYTSLAAGAFLIHATALSQPVDQTYRPEAVATIWHIADSSLDSGGDWSVTGYRLGGGKSWDAGNGDSIGMDVTLEHQEHQYNGAFQPWDSVRRIEVSFTWNRSLSERWNLLVMPTLGLSMEDGADSSEAVEFGGILALNKFASPALQWGFGFGLFAGLEDNTAFPLLLVRWQIDDHWYLGNPFTPGPVGPAGLELGYRFDGGWSLAAGSAYRSERFRLKQSGPYADGFGETEGMILFVRASHPLGSGQLHLFMGTPLAGEMSVDDQNGDTILKTDFDPAPMAAISWQGRF